MKKRGKWYVIADVGTKPDNSRNQRWFPTGTSNKKEAEEIHYPEIMRQVLGGTPPIDHRLTLDDFLTNKWLPFIFHHVKSTTYNTYMWATKNHIIPALGKTPLRRLRPPTIQAFLDGYKERAIAYKAHLLETERAKAIGREIEPMKKTIGGTSIRYLYNVLYESLKYAQDQQLLSSNPCAPIKAPKKDEYDPVLYDEKQMNKLLLAAVNTDIYLPIVLAGTNGLRIGEVCGLRWTDIDYNDALMLVRHSLDWVDNKTIANPINQIIWHHGKLGLRPVKSKHSERLIPQPDIALDALKKSESRSDELKQRFGSAFHDFNFVWCREDGLPHSPDYLYKEFKELLDNLGLPEIRFHDLRHSHATILRDKGVSMETISERLGHHSLAFTHKKYAHPTRNTQNAAAQAMNKAFPQIPQPSKLS